jgi:hypothetical protein
MVVKLHKKISDDWSRTDIFSDCHHRIGSYIKRNGRRYTGDLSEREQERFSKALNINFNDRDDYWNTYHIAIDGKNNVTLNTENIEDEFAVAFLEKHKEVALGYNDRKPGTKYVLIKEEDEAEKVNKRAQVKIRAITEYGKLTPEQMRKALRLYGHNSSSVSNEIVQSTLYNLVEDDPGKFLTLWVDNDNKETHFLIEEAVANNVIRNNKTIYKYGTDIIGYTIEEAIDYLKDPRNANLRLAIISQMEGKKETETPIEDRTVKSQFKKILEEIEEENEEKSVEVDKEVTTKNKKSTKKESSDISKIK